MNATKNDRNVKRVSKLVSQVRVDLQRVRLRTDRILRGLSSATTTIPETVECEWRRTNGRK